MSLTIILEIQLLMSAINYVHLNVDWVLQQIDLTNDYNSNSNLSLV